MRQRTRPVAGEYLRLHYQLCLVAAFVATAALQHSWADTFGSGANTFDIEFVDIGNPGNAADTTGSPNPAGKVDYAYRIGKFEISEQMIDKANALGGLGITKTLRGADKPATGVSWNEAARFLNWLNTSSGSLPAYKFAVQPGQVGYDANANIELWTISDAGYNPNNLYRNSLARYFFPSVDEWYKAAYYDPISGVYFNYPTGRDSVPDGIDFAGDPSFDAVFYDDGIVSSPNDITNAGVLSPYGTMGQGGNVYEWEETDFDLVNGPRPSLSFHGVRGGSWGSPGASNLLATERSYLPTFGNGSANGGFRVASSTPEPSTLLLLCFGSLTVLWRRRRVVCAAILAAVFGISLSNDAYAADIRTVALSGQQAPGTLNGVSFRQPFWQSELGSTRFQLSLNDAGQTAFRASLTGSGVNSTNDLGIWSEGSGSLVLVARTGSQVPGAPDGVTFVNVNFAYDLVLNDAGQTAFFARQSTSPFHYGLWSEGSGSLGLVARSGDSAPGLPDGVNFGADVFINHDLLLNDAGQTTFIANLAGSGINFTNARGLWSGGAGSLALVARLGDHAPGTPDGVNYRNFGFGSSPLPPVLNDVGQTAFFASVSGSGVDSTNDEGIWSEGSGTLALVSREGDHAPGTPSGVNYSTFHYFFDSPVLNNSGQTAFRAALIGSGVDTTNNEGIWSEGSGTLALVARKGDHAPGTPNGVVYGLLSGQILNNAGQTAFRAVLTGSGIDFSNDAGIWLNDAGSIVLVARKGDHAPGTPVGVNFSSTSAALVLNDAGQIAFRASVAGSEVGFTNDNGIWATDRSGALQLIAREGDLLEVAPGDFRTISGFSRPLQGDATLDSSTGNSDGRRSGFNNLGQLAFLATFTDGSSGIFVSNRVAVPEPSTLLLVALGLVVFALRSKS